MPRYDYQCEQCGRQVEDVQTVEERDNVPACRRCGGRMVRQPAAPAFQLRGPGFHVNDYPKGRKY